MKDKKEELIKKYEQIRGKMSILEKEERDISIEYEKINRKIIKKKKFLSRLHWIYSDLKGNPIIRAKEELNSNANEDIKELYRVTGHLSLGAYLPDNISMISHCVPFYLEFVNWEKEQDKHIPALHFYDSDIYISMEICFIDKIDPLTVLFDFCKEWDIKVDFSPLEKIISEKKKEYKAIENILEKIKK